MQLWFSRNTQVPVREQLVTQIVLAIQCNELKPGDRLPSVREIARRLRIHANTVSAAYRQLARSGWVEFRRGSGVYVYSSNSHRNLDASGIIDQKIGELFRVAREVGIPLVRLHERLRFWTALRPPERIIVIEPDPELRAIMECEVAQRFKLRIDGHGLEDSKGLNELSTSIVVAFPKVADQVKKLASSHTEIVKVHSPSVPRSLEKWLPVNPEVLLAVASRWDGFLKLGGSILAAAGLSPESIILRNVRQAGWKRGLREVTAVVCDAMTAGKLQDGIQSIVFPVISEASLQDLSSHLHFLRRGLTGSM